jgi:hypothetical protein
MIPKKRYLEALGIEVLNCIDSLLPADVYMTVVLEQPRLGMLSYLLDYKSCGDHLERFLDGDPTLMKEVAKELAPDVLDIVKNFSSWGFVRLGGGHVMEHFSYKHSAPVFIYTFSFNPP